MKKTIWNKSMSEYTGLETLKWAAAFLAIIYGIFGAIYVMILKLDDICAWVTQKRRLIHNKFRDRMYWDTEEDEGLD